MKFIFGIIVVLIVYGSLFPFSFSMREATSANVNALFNFNITRTGLSDLVSNVILFVPFGLFIRSAFPGEQYLNTRYNAAKYLGYLFIAFVFALCIQAAQVWTSDRIPWGGDAVWNSVGCAIGLFMYSFIKIDAFTQFYKLSAIRQISFALAVALIFVKLAPYAPSMDLGVLKDNIKALIKHPSVDIYDVLEHTITWIVAFYLLHVANPSWSKCRVLIIVVICVLGLKFLIVTSNITSSKLLAGAIALTGWRIFLAASALEKNPHNYGVTEKNARRISFALAVSMFFVIVGNGLYPFEFSEQVGDFSWIPFASSLSGNLIINIIAITKKLAIYSALVWLLYLSKRSLAYATISAMLIIFVTEFLQLYFTDSTSDITDALLPLFASFIFSQKLKYEQRSCRKRIHRA